MRFTLKIKDLHLFIWKFSHQSIPEHPCIPDQPIKPIYHSYKYQYLNGMQTLVVRMKTQAHKLSAFGICHFWQTLLEFKVFKFKTYNSI